eukprot:TRINITY_DN58049_c0_g1_i10.p3 TRINITY_DN58049_c0_g1~~TRINITY_DN58049_c0_g1_i10.p3  ORF type:complete len:143 (+),score=4.92 TRINITY_DN58049_c0_g1_i10:38-466(+)
MFSFSIFFFFFFHRQSRVFTRAFDSRFQGVCIGHTLFLFYFCFFFFFFFCWCTHRFFFFNDTATTEIYTNLNTLSLHDALPIQVLLLQSGRCFFFKVHTSQKTVAFLARKATEPSIFGQEDTKNTQEQRIRLQQQKCRRILC